MNFQIVKETQNYYCALCPYHKEKVPSLMIHRNGKRAGSWKCWGCGKYGTLTNKEIQRLNISKTNQIKRRLPEDYQKLLLFYQQQLNKQFGVEISLANNKGYIIIDENKKDFVNCKKWHLSKNFSGTEYAAYTDYSTNPPSQLRLHCLLLGLNYEDNCQVDHINSDGLDNRLCNLRICNQNENQHNQKIKPNSYKSIHWCKRDKRWIAQIQLNTNRVHIGNFENKIDAAKAYDKKAKELFGQFARLNFPEIQEYRLKDLANDLAISVQTLRNSDIGWYNNKFIWPMRNVKGQIIGLQTRNKIIDGRKLNLAGSELGLFYTYPVKQQSQLIICEGLTDYLTLSDWGFWAVGIVSATTNLKIILNFVFAYRPKCVILLADTDKVGIDLMCKIRNKILKSNLENKNVSLIIPPTPAKDIRNLKQRWGSKLALNWLKTVINL